MSTRPAEPPKTGVVWYRNWEVSYEADRASWTGEGWTAYKGGCDLGAPCVAAASFSGCLDLIDDDEEDE